MVGEPGLLIKRDSKCKTVPQTLLQGLGAPLLLECQWMSHLLGARTIWSKFPHKNKVFKVSYGLPRQTELVGPKMLSHLKTFG